ncbi:taste receptor type 1 member 3 [Rhinophrynus dorsalis]
MVLLFAFNVEFVIGETEDLESVAYQIFKKPGDLVIGGLFPFHASHDNVGNYWKPEPLTCTSLNPTGILQALAMQFTVEEINNSTTLLPRKNLGYEVYDTCLSSLAILHPVLLFLARHGTQDIDVTCNLTEYQPRVLAVIGPSSSEIATTSMKLLSTFRIPQLFFGLIFQISYSVTAGIFSDKTIFPSFLRTVPSDKKQIDGMVSLISYFKWNWIAVVTSEDDYGQTALRQFSSSAISSGICIACEGIIPLYLSSNQTRIAIADTLDMIEKTNIKVVLVFSSLSQSILLFQEVIKRNMTRVWIGSASWVLSESVLSLPGIEHIGTVIGFFPTAHTVLGFDRYLRDVISEMYTLPLFHQLQLDNSSGASEDKMHVLLNPLTELHAQHVYKAVYAVAHALHNLLNCDTEKCNEEDFLIYPWKLLEEVKKVNFTVFNTPFSFDQYGNPNSGYDIVTLSPSEVRFTRIGLYNNHMELNSSLINWGTEMNEVPESQCSSKCMSGQIRRVKGTHSCCFDCIDCQEGMYQAFEGQWSNRRSSSCSHPTYLYLQWSDISVILLLLLTSFLLCLIVGTFIIFFKHRITPIVQASGGNMSFFALFSLLVVAFSIVLFIVKPVDIVCQMQQPLLAMGFTCCLSMFSVKALQVMLVTDFKGVPPKYIQWLKTKGTWIFLICSILIQVLLCTWHIQSNIHLTPKKEVTFLYKYLTCEITNIPSFIVMHGYNVILALISFMLNCVAQAPPGQYNLARDITFSMLAYLFIWIVFAPLCAEVTDGNQSLLQMAVILISSFGIMLGYFAPKCYILLLKPGMGAEEYFKIYNV